MITNKNLKSNISIKTDAKTTIIEYIVFTNLDIITPAKNPIKSSTTMPKTITAIVSNIIIY